MNPHRLTIASTREGLKLSFTFGYAPNEKLPNKPGRRKQLEQYLRQTIEQVNTGEWTHLGHAESGKERIYRDEWLVEEVT